MRLAMVRPRDSHTPNQAPGSGSKRRKAYTPRRGQQHRRPNSACSLQQAQSQQATTAHSGTGILIKFSEGRWIIIAQIL